MLTILTIINHRLTMLTILTIINHRLTMLTILTIINHGLTMKSHVSVTTNQPLYSHIVQTLWPRLAQTFILSGSSSISSMTMPYHEGSSSKPAPSSTSTWIFTRLDEETEENLWKPMKTYGFMRKTHGKSSTKGGIKPWTMEISWVNGLFKGKSMVETKDFPIKYGEIFCTYSLKPTHWIMGFCFMTMVISYFKGCDTVDGRNPAPPGMVESLYKKWDKPPIDWCRISSIHSML